MNIITENPETLLDRATGLMCNIILDDGAIDDLELRNVDVMTVVVAMEAGNGPELEFPHDRIESIEFL